MKHLITIAFALLAGAVWSQDYNYSVKVDSNGVLRTPTGFIPSNNIATVTAMNASNAAQDSAVSASNAVQDASIGSKVSTNDAAYLAGLTNGVGSGATVTITGRTFYVSVATDTNSAASVQADLDDHKTNVTAHSGLFDSYGSAIAVSNAYTNASALALTALQPASTQSWEVGSHASFATNTDPRLALAATALQPDGMGSNLVAYVYDPIGSIDTTKLTVSGAGNTAVDGTYTWDADWPYTDSIAGATNGAFVQSTSNYFIGRWYGCSSAWVLSTNGGFAETGTEYDTPYDGDPLSPTNGWVANAGPAPAPTVVFYGTPQVYRVSRVAELALDAYPRNNPSGFVTSATGISDATASNIAAGVVGASNLITLAQAAVLTNSLLATNGNGAGLSGITPDQIGALSTNGGALNGAVTTVRSNGWAGNELITADGVRGFLSSGKALYMTTNVFNASWQPTNTTTIGVYEPTAYSTRFSVGISSANQYIATLVDTNPISAGVEMVGPATVVINLFTPSGAQTSLSVKPEIYYTYDLNATTLTLGDFDASAQAITVGVTNAYTWSIAFASVVPTSTYYRVYRLKTTAKGNNTTTASIGLGGAIDSYVLYQQGADTLGARGAIGASINGTTGTYNTVDRFLTLTNVISPILIPTPLPVVAGTGTVESTSFVWTLGTMASNVVVTVGASMTNEAAMRGFFLSWNPVTYSITFPTTVFTNYSTFTTGKVWNSYWVSGPGQTLFSGGGK